MNFNTFSAKNFNLNKNESFYRLVLTKKNTSPILNGQNIRENLKRPCFQNHRFIKIILLLTLSQWIAPCLRKCEILRDNLVTPPKCKACKRGRPPAIVNKSSVLFKIS